MHATNSSPTPSAAAVQREPSTAPALEIHDMTVAYHRKPVLWDVDLVVPEGKLVGIVGPNGAGKTTLIKAVLGLLPLASGKVEIYGKPYNEQRHLIGYVPQLLSADGALTGYENLLIFAKLYDLPRAVRRQRIDALLDLMGLQNAAQQMVKTYSGGMIRRLEIAQSVLHQPRLLFLDEPTVGLDPIARKSVWEHIQRLRREFSTTILLTTHYMEEAEGHCQRVAILHRGKVVAIGSPAQLKASLNGGTATLDQVFAHYAGAEIETSGSYIEVSRTRTDARRVG